MMNRREFLASSLAFQAGGRRPPNVVLIMTDDQGFGDCSLHGNPHLRTPNMDRVAQEGVRFTQFHVNPVCSPTRSSLMTGRYYYRTGVVDTYLGRSMMYPDEFTMAEMLGSAGYATGIFGKWHLGDNYPMRANDQGFQKSVVIRGGGLGQPSDVPNGGSYFNPVLFHDGEPERFKGYCTDIYTNEALKFVEQNRSKPFFCYLPTNAPHDPLEIDDALVAPFLKAGLDEKTARTYAMVSNVDSNIGRVLKRLDDLQLSRDTILIFMTDNGPQRARFNAGMRGIKGTVYEGGIRVPFFVRWPAMIKPGSQIDRLSGHIDLFPTIAEACGAKYPSKIDGRSLLPLMKDPRSPWQDRTMFFQWHRGDAPQLYRDCAARDQRWKMVNGKELYDLVRDPSESKDISADMPDVLRRLNKEYESWFQDVSKTRGYVPPRIHIGNPAQDITVLTRQDWRGPKAAWTPEAVGYWEVEVEKSALYEIRAIATKPGKIRVSLGPLSLEAIVPQPNQEFRVGTLRLPAGPGRIEALVNDTIGPHMLTIRRTQ